MVHLMIYVYYLLYVFLIFIYIKEIESSSNGEVLMPALPNSDNVQCVHIKVDTLEPTFDISSLYLESCYELTELSSVSSASSSSPGQ